MALIVPARALQGQLFMKEAHMAVVATLLDRAIVVYDDRDRKSGLPGFTVLYSPGYSPFKAIGKVQARELADKRDGTLWVHLTPGHYTVLKRNA